MRWTSLFFFLFFAFAGGLCFAQTPGQTTTPPPQTAREALLEMFAGKTPDGFEKHLPDVTRRVLLKTKDPRTNEMLLGISGAIRELNAQGRQVETFNAGPVLLSAEDKEGRSKIEIAVEGDDLQGDEDRIELSVHAYQNGAPQALPVVPRFVFTMKQEKDLWRLNEITLVVHIPLADPDYLKGLQKMQGESQQSSTIGQVRTLIGQVRTLVTAEVAYAASYPRRGFTCKLAELGGAENGGSPTEHHAMLIDPQTVTGETDGYKFTISGCDSVPASKFQVTAVPIDSDTEMKAYCTDESGIIRYADDGNAATCLSAGEVLKTSTVTFGDH